MVVGMELSLYTQSAAERLVRYRRKIVHNYNLSTWSSGSFLLLTITTSNHRWQRAASTLGCLGVACLLGTSEQPTASSRRDCFDCQAPVALAVSQESSICVEQSHLSLLSAHTFPSQSNPDPVPVPVPPTIHFTTAAPPSL